MQHIILIDDSYTHYYEANHIAFFLILVFSFHPSATELIFSPWTPGKCWPVTSWRSCKDTGRARRHTGRKACR